MEKIKVSFEPTDIWNREEFRHLIDRMKQGIYNDVSKEYELWIITTNSSLIFINALASQLEIPVERTIMALNDTTKIGLINLNSNIHFDGDYSIIHALEPTLVRGILVDQKIVPDAIGFKYIQDLTKWTEVILRERNGDEKKVC